MEGNDAPPRPFIDKYNTLIVAQWRGMGAWRAFVIQHKTDQSIAPPLWQHFWDGLNQSTEQAGLVWGMFALNCVYQADADPNSKKWP